MAEEKKEEKKKGGGIFGEKADRIVTFILGGAGLGYVGKQILSKLAGKLTEKGVEVAEKKIEKALGLDIEEAKKGLDDEFLYRIALHGLNDDTKRKQINQFKADLEETDSNKAEAFVLYVAKMLRMHEKQQKKSWKTGKGKNAPRVEEIAKLYDFTYTNDFFADLLSNDTVDAKTRFLKNEKVFSLIPPEKKIWKSVKEAGCRIADKVAAKKPEVSEKTEAKKTAKKIRKSIKKSAKAVDNEADDLGKWINKNIHKKVEYRGFWSEWNWFLKPLLKKMSRKKKNQRGNRRRPSGNISAKLKEIVLTVENRMLARLARSR